MKATWISTIEPSLKIHGFMINKDNLNSRGTHSYGKTISMTKMANRSHINHLKNALKRSSYQMLSCNKRRNQIFQEVQFHKSNLIPSRSFIRKMDCSLILLNLKKNLTAAQSANLVFSISARKWKMVSLMKNASKERTILGGTQRTLQTMVR